MKTTLLRLLLLVLLCAFAAEAQTTSVSGTITAADSQTYNNGTYTFQLVGGNGPFYLGGVLMTTGQVTITGALDSGGSFTSVAVGKTASISPAGTSWLFTACPLASAPCWSQNIGIVSGTTLNISSTITPPAIKVTPTPNVLPLAYNDSEIQGPQVGTNYYNLTSAVARICVSISGGVCTWSSEGAQAVSSVFGRTGAVVAASGDYTAAQVTGAMPQFSGYTIFLATDSTCTVPSYSGTVACAKNNTTGAFDFESTDARPVVQGAVTNMASTCGTITFKNGTYNFNTMLQESTGTFVNFYGLGIPGQSGSLNCEWHLEGEGGAVLCCEAVLGPFNTGVIFNITSTAVTSIGASTNTYVGIWARPDVTNGLGPTVYMKNIAVRRPNNQRGCSTGIDMQNALTADWYNVITDYTTAYASLAVPVAGTSCSDAGHGVTTSDEVGIRTTQTAKNDNHFFNSHAVGSNLCMDILSEHSFLVHSGAQFCNFGIYYGRAGAGPVVHPSVWTDMGVGECIRPLTLGTNLAYGSSLNIIGWDEEDATASTFSIWQPTYQASELNPGNTVGELRYTVVLANVGVTHVPNLFLLGNAGGGVGMQQIQSTSASNFWRTGEADSFTRANTTGCFSSGIGLGPPWLNNVNCGSVLGLSIISNSATTNNAGSGAASWAQPAFNDQFSQATVNGSMITTSAVAVTVNNTTSSQVQTYNEYICSTSGTGLVAKRGIYKIVATVATNLVQTASNSGCAATDVLRLERVGTFLNAYYCPTGTGVINGVCSTLDLTISDSSILNGEPGIAVINNVTAHSVGLISWTGGSYPLFDNVHSIYQQPASHPMYLSNGTAPTPTGTGACATITTQIPAAVGSQAGSLKCTGTTGASTITLTFPATQTAPNGYRCSADDETTVADRPNQTSSTTTTCVLTTTTTVQNDVIVWNASPF